MGQAFSNWKRKEEQRKEEQREREAAERQAISDRLRELRSNKKPSAQDQEEIRRLIQLLRELTEQHLKHLPYCEDFHQNNPRATAMIQQALKADRR
jgi:hypothetical protein